MPQLDTRYLLTRCRDAGVGALCESANLPADAMARLFGDPAEIIELLPGDTFSLRRPDGTDRILLIERGALLTVAASPGPLHGITGLGLSSDIIGLESVSADHEPRLCRAVSDCTVQAISADVLQAERANSQRILEATDRLLCNEIRRREQQYLVVCHCDAEQRLAIFLLSLLLRHTQLTRLASHVDLMLARCDIADLLGLRLETVSRKLGQLRDDGVIALDRRYLSLIDPGALFRRAGLPSRSAPSAGRATAASQ